MHSAWQLYQKVLDTQTNTLKWCQQHLMINLQGSLSVWVWQVDRDVSLNTSRNWSSWCHHSCNLLQMWLWTDTKKKEILRAADGNHMLEMETSSRHLQVSRRAGVADLQNDIILSACESVGRLQWVRAQKAEVWLQRESLGRAVRRLCSDCASCRGDAMSPWAAAYSTQPCGLMKLKTCVKFFESCCNIRCRKKGLQAIKKKKKKLLGLLSDVVDPWICWLIKSSLDSRGSINASQPCLAKLPPRPPPTHRHTLSRPHTPFCPFDSCTLNINTGASREVALLGELMTTPAQGRREKRRRQKTTKWKSDWNLKKKRRRRKKKIQQSEIKGGDAFLRGSSALHFLYSRVQASL